MAWYGMARYGMVVWYGMVRWYGMVWCSNLAPPGPRIILERAGDLVRQIGLALPQLQILWEVSNQCGPPPPQPPPHPSPQPSPQPSSHHPAAITPSVTRHPTSHSGVTVTVTEPSGQKPISQTNLEGNAASKPSVLKLCWSVSTLYCWQGSRC